MFPFMINGKPLKALNQWDNKEKARWQSFVGEKSSRRIRQLTFRRNQQVSDYLHKTSRMMINDGVEHQIGKIIMGKNPGWKQGMALGTRNHQQFVNIPFARLIDMLTYKAEQIGMTVECTEEADTSKGDHLAGERMEHKEQDLGKRVKRGLFQSSIGRMINAEVNGVSSTGMNAHGDGR